MSSASSSSSSFSSSSTRNSNVNTNSPTTSPVLLLGQSGGGGSNSAGTNKNASSSKSDHFYVPATSMPPSYSPSASPSTVYLRARAKYNNSSGFNLFNNLSSSSNHTNLTLDGPIAAQGSSAGASTMDVLAAIFFVVAATWLVAATLYAGLVYMYLRLRARGRLDRIYEPDFGRMRLPFCGWVITLPLACLLRRYVRHLHGRAAHGAHGANNLGRGPFVTREERRRAMEVLLVHSKKSSHGTESGREHGIQAPSIQQEQPMENETDEQIAETSSDYQDALAHIPTSDSGSTEGPVCSICLGDYNDDGPDQILQSQTCPHQFHRDCILDWLERQENTECPCCRVPMVEDDDVWKVVQKIRKERRKSSKLRKMKRNEESGSGSAALTPAVMSMDPANIRSPSFGIVRSPPPSFDRDDVESNSAEAPIPVSRRFDREEDTEQQIQPAASSTDSSDGTDSTS